MAAIEMRRVVKNGVMYKIMQDTSTQMEYVTAAYSVEKDLTEIHIYASVEGIPVVSIEAGAFAQMPKLEKVVIAENTAISLEGAVFSGCPRLKTVYSFSANTSLGTQVFKDCPNLKEVWAAGNLYLLGQNIFDKCSCLSSLTGDIAKVRDFAFGGSPLFQRLTFAQNAKFTKNAMVAARAKLLIFYGDVVFAGNANASMFQDFNIECKKNSMLADLVYEGINVSFW